MEIYLMRHGEAVNPHEWRKSDSERPLTPVGVAKLESGLQDMMRAGFSVSTVFTSPLARARATAEITAKAFSAPEPTVLNELAAGAPMETLRKMVIAHASEAPFLIVGHMPEMAVFGSRIASEPSLLDQGLLPGDVLALETGELEKSWGEGKMLWWRKITDWKKLAK